MDSITRAEHTAREQFNEQCSILSLIKLRNCNIGFWIYFFFFVYNCKFLGYLPFVDLYFFLLFLFMNILNIGGEELKLRSFHWLRCNFKISEILLCTYVLFPVSCTYVTFLPLIIMLCFACVLSVVLSLWNNLLTFNYSRKVDVHMNRIVNVNKLYSFQHIITAHLEIITIHSRLFSKLNNFS